MKFHWTLAAVGCGFSGLLFAPGCSDRDSAANSSSSYANPATSVTATPEKIDFNQHIRPILNQNCVICHGGVKNAGKIGFVFREEATRAGESGRVTIKPGDPDGSEIIARLTTKDPEKRMPPVDHGQALAPGQIALFRQWIKEGATWAEHWAFIAPKPQTVPGATAVAGKPWARSEIDRFILAKLEKETLRPAPEADRSALLRRASLDLTGLPPSAAEIEAFLSDSSPQAYEKQVDRLLASPRYGERWTSLWLDLARYADTKGYEADRPRAMWQYRDWLIDALNRNLPYDQFVTEQLAGDLLPHPTLRQIVATAFHRNTQVNDEGGTEDEEFRIAAVQDRAATTWSVFNGVTFNCVQCHSHPYDPIRNQDYYKFLAFFNSTRDSDYEFDYPTLRVPDQTKDTQRSERLQISLEKLLHELAAPAQALAAEPTMWRASPISGAKAEPAATVELRNGEAFATGTIAEKTVLDFTLAENSGSEVTALKIEVSPLNPAKARHSPELGFLVVKIEVHLVHADGCSEDVPLDAFWSDTTHHPAPYPPPPPPKPTPGAPVETGPKLPPGGFASAPTLSRPRWIVAVPARPISLDSNTRVKVRLHHRGLISSKPAVVRRTRVELSSDPRWTRLSRDIDAAGKRRELEKIEKDLYSIPGTQLPVMADLPSDERRETRVFQRGNWMEKTGEPLTADVPALFPPLPKDAPRNRLTLARWLFDPAHPLTARVAVNRMWEQLFGIGIVETLEDFGSVGLPPSHPELLDWLAIHFRDDLHWDMKAQLRELVTSSTYRQSARTDEATRVRDPRNRLLARGPRNRLMAEMVRDQALLASGLLSPTLYGPPVMPPQPVGVWNSVYNGAEWKDATGPDRYRRAVYTYWKRTSAYPSFLTFDAPTRDVCAIRRTPTNTPLQALVTLNDPVYQEAAVALAESVSADTSEAGAVAETQIAIAFRRVTSRFPEPAELAPLLSLYRKTLERYSADVAATSALGVPQPETAALSAVTAALFNLDAALTK